MAANVATLAEHHPTYTVDGLGQAGASVQTVPIRRPQDNAEWINDVLKGLGVERVHLVGWSYGGWMSFHYALAEPARVASLTLVEPANTVGRISAGFLARMFALPLAARAPGTFFDSVLDRCTAWMVHGPGSQDLSLAGVVSVVELLRAAIREYRPYGVPYPSFPNDHKLRSLRPPAYVLLAGRSAVHDSGAGAHRLRVVVPDAAVEIWPAATHALPVEFADEVNQRILTFVAQHN